MEGSCNLKTASDELSLDELEVPALGVQQNGSSILVENDGGHQPQDEDLEGRQLYQLNNNSSDSLLHRVPSSLKEHMNVAMQSSSDQLTSTNFDFSKVSASQAHQQTNELLQASLTNLNEQEHRFPGEKRAGKKYKVKKMVSDVNNDSDSALRTYKVSGKVDSLLKRSLGNKGRQKRHGTQQMSDRKKNQPRDLDRFDNDFEEEVQNNQSTAD